MFKYIYWNANGLFNMNRYTQLQFYLSNNKPDLLCISECKIDKNTTIDLSNMNYNNISFFNTSLSSGLLFIYKSCIHIYNNNKLSLSDHDKKSLTVPSMLEWIEIKLYDTNLLIGGIYIHPKASSNDLSILFKNINKVIDLQVPIVLLGDWNAHHALWDSNCVNNMIGERLFELIENKNLYILNCIYCNNYYTHTFGSIHSIIDIGISNNNAFISSFDVGYDIPLLSDHVPITVTFSSPTLYNNNEYYYWNLHHANWISYRLELNENLKMIDIDNLQQLYHEPQQLINELCDQVTNSVLDAANIYVGKIKNKNNKNEWFYDKKVKMIHEYLHKIHHYYQRHYDDQNVKLLYKDAKMMYKLVVQFVKNQYFQKKLFKLSDKNRNVVWKHWKNLSYKNRPQSLPLLNSFQTPVEALNHLCTHFSTISSTSSINTSQLSNHQSLEYLTIRKQVQEFIDNILLKFKCDENITIPFAYEDVKNQCMNCENKGMGPDDIHVLFIKQGTEVLYSFLFKLFSLCFVYSIYPDSWKVAKIKPKYKNGARSDLSNYRPLSITSIFSRLFENILLPILISKTSMYISPFQAGFRHDYSTLDNIYILNEYVMNAYRHDSFLPVIFIDMQKAFDTVWINGLLYKLYLLNVDLSIIKLLYSFLSNRFIYVVYDNYKSFKCPISFSVPQGCVLSPHLFSLFINSLSTILPLDIICLLFADDICIISKRIGSVGLARLQVGLNALQNECIRWQFKISLPKTRVVLFSKTPISVSSSMRLKLNNDFIDFSNSYKYLGVEYECDGKFSIHERAMLNKARIVNFYINKLCMPGLVISPLIIRNLIKCVLIPTFTYAIALWRPSDEFIRKCDSIIMSSFRLLLHLPSTISITSLYQEFRLFPIKFLRNWLLFLFVDRVLKKDPLFPARQIMMESLNYEQNNQGTYVYTRTEHAIIKRKKTNVIQQFQHLQKASQPFIFDLKYINIHHFINNYSTYSKQQIKYSMFEEFIQQSSLLSNSTTLHKITSSSISFDLPLYFTTLSIKEIIRLFRLRFDITNFNANIIHRHSKNTNIKCIYCNNVDETREHVLLYCPQYAIQRQLLQEQLHMLGIHHQLSLPMLCGEYPIINGRISKSEKYYKKFILRIMEFINYIYKIRLQNGII
jgi:hypothetical protein